MSTEEKKAAVQIAANEFAEIEIALEALEPRFDKLVELIGSAYDAGVPKHAEAVRLRQGIKGAKGLVASALEKVLEVHALGTKIVIREKCDVPPNLAIDGGLVRPMSGGR